MRLIRSAGGIRRQRTSPFGRIVATRASLADGAGGTATDECVASTGALTCGLCLPTTGPPAGWTPSARASKPGAARCRLGASGPRTATSPRRGTAGDPTWPNGSGAPCARTTRPTAPPGSSSRTIMPARAPTAGARTACSAVRRPDAVVLRAGAVERARPDPEGAPVRPDRAPRATTAKTSRRSYFYLDGTPTHSYMRALYKYPQRAFPYAELVAENRRRGRAEPEFELRRHRRFRRRSLLGRRGRVRQGRPDDIVMRITATNRGPDARRCTCCRRCGFATPGAGARR